MRTLKLMPDYYSFPLWETGGENYNVDPFSLPISDELASDLVEWAEKYDKILNMEVPQDSGFESQEDLAEFNQCGIDLKRRLQEELGDSFKVEYSFESTVKPNK